VTSGLLYSIRRRLSRIACLFGRHRFKMGVTDRAGIPFACSRCRRSSDHLSTPPPSFDPLRIEADRQYRNETDPLLTDAARQVRRLFGGRL
jgi:hypothetical protein